MSTGRPRSAHALKHNKGSRTPRTMFFFDTESWRTPGKEPGETEHRLRLGWVCHWERRSDRDTDRVAWFCFHTQQELWDWVLERCRPRERPVIVAHNMSFDLIVGGAKPCLEAAGFVMEGLYDRNRTFIGKFKRPCPVEKGRTQSLVFIDNFNYCPYPLAEVGRIVGLDKGEIDFDGRTDAEITEEELSPYCRNDVAILVAFWQSYTSEIATEDLGNWSQTLAGQALAAFRHRFMVQPIFIHDSAKTLALERKCYYGGRVECFRVGDVDGPVWHVDVNSMYPSVMREEPLPCRLITTRSLMSVDELRAEIAGGRAVCAKVEIETEEPFYPVRGTGGLIFPVGHFTTYLTTPELARAVERDEIRAVRFVAVYEAAVLFREYVDYFYTRRLEARAAGDTVRAEIRKMMMNALAGKFGQKSPVWEEIGADNGDGTVVSCEDVYSGVTGARYMTRQIGERVEICRGYTESYNSFPAIPAHVAAYGRARLWHLIETAGRDHVFYCDTDSLFVDAIGLERLSGYMHGTGLGALSVRDEAPAVQIRAPKDYTFGRVVKRKGIRAKAIQIAPDTWRQEVWPGFSAQMRAGHTDHFVTTTGDKHLTGAYHKGTVSASGEVSPLRIEGG